ncbi:hypothetical protein BGW42_008281 [Actinomortierella wolfii]|nr:hypothetical protein BGW42_008281 [Actinomortierella wolfii]
MDILQQLKKYGMSLSGFLTELFTCEDPRVTQWTNEFHSLRGTSKVMEVWDRNVIHIKEYDTPFAESAVDSVIRRVDRELNKLRVLSHYRCSPDEISQKKLENLLEADFFDNYGSEATLLTRLLKGLTMEDNATTRSSHRSKIFRATISAMLLFNKSPESNAFQMLNGLHSRMINSQKNFFKILSTFGLSVRRNVTDAALETLTKEARRRVQEAVAKNDWYLTYGNLDVAMEYHNKTTGRCDTVKNGTAGAVIMIPKNIEVPDADHIFRADRRTPYIKDFILTGPEDAMRRKLCRTHVATSIARAYGRTDLKFDFDKIDCLETIKTETYTLSALPINRASVMGTLNVVEAYIEKDLGLDKFYFYDHSEHHSPVDRVQNTATGEQTDQQQSAGQQSGNRDQASVSMDQKNKKKRAIIFAGDCLTTNRLRELKMHRSVDPDRYHGMKWIQPVLQLSVDIPGSLAAHIALLRRNYITYDKAKFGDVELLIKHVYDATVSLLWETLKEDGTLMKPDEILRVASIIEDAMHVSVQERPSIFGRPCTNAEINALRFLRDASAYFELVESIKVGDIGRIHNILPMIMMMMHGTKDKLWARELLRLVFNLRNVWTDKWKRLVLSSMLVNLKGLPDSWIATDMYQNHISQILRTVVALGESNMSSSDLNDTISYNSWIFSKVGRVFQSEIDTNYNSHSTSTHHKPYPVMDIELLKITLKGQGLFRRRGKVNLLDSELFNDLLVLGTEKLNSSAIGRFIKGDECSDEDEEEWHERWRFKHDIYSSLEEPL